jgi:spore maturation protein CgeB
MVNEKYARELNRARIFFTCGGEFQYAVAKFFEAPGCRTLLLAKPNKDILELGFKDGVNFVACNESDFYDKAIYYLRNYKERERITNNGYHFIHTTTQIESGHNSL